MGIFDTQVNLFTRYRATLQFRDRLMGGIPQDPTLIEGWLRSKAGITDDQEVRSATIRTLRELGAAVPEEATEAQLAEASKLLAAESHTNGFKRDPQLGLYVEGRAVKALIKENVSILLTGARLKTGAKTAKGIDLEKAARSVVAERVHVAEQVIPLGRTEPDGTHLFVGHVMGPSGPASTLTYFQYVDKPTISFTVLVVEPCLDTDQWARVWVLAQENGFGALRSQSFGRFDITEWTKSP